MPRPAPSSSLLNEWGRGHHRSRCCGCHEVLLLPLCPFPAPFQASASISSLAPHGEGVRLMRSACPALVRMFACQTLQRPLCCLCVCGCPPYPVKATEQLCRLLCPPIRPHVQDPGLGWRCASFSDAQCLLQLWSWSWGFLPSAVFGLFPLCGMHLYCPVVFSSPPIRLTTSAWCTPWADSGKQSSPPRLSVSGLWP